MVDKPEALARLAELLKVLHDTSAMLGVEYQDICRYIEDENAYRVVAEEQIAGLIKTQQVQARRIKLIDFYVDLLWELHKALFVLLERYGSARLRERTRDLERIKSDMEEWKTVKRLIQAGDAVEQIEDEISRIQTRMEKYGTKD